MTNRSQLDLDFGQLADITYDADASRWQTERPAEAASTLRPLFAPDDTDITQEHDLSQPLREPERSRVIYDAVGLYPSLQPATEVISQYLSEWPVVPVEDVSEGNLLALVDAKEADRTDRYSWSVRDADHPILVIPGPGRSEIQFIELIRRRTGWNNDKKRWLESWAINNQPAASWASDGSAILQICAPQAVQSRDLASTFAARMPDKIQIFYPQHNRAYTPSTRHVTAENRSLPKISPCPAQMIHIPAKRGRVCVDITFNTWDHSQLCAITSDGLWIVWNIQATKVKRITRSSMIPHAVESDAAVDNEVADDGWYRITWLDANHVLTCHRYAIQLFDLGGESLVIWSLPQPSPHHRIADIQKSPSDEPLVFVVSTNFVLLLRISAEPSETNVELLASWKHRLDPSDMSLRVCPYSHDQDASALLYSRRHPYIIQYRYSRLERHQLTYDPVRTCHMVDARLGLLIQSLSMPADGPSSHLNVEGVTYWQTFSLGTNFLPTEHLWCPTGSTVSDSASQLQVPDWMKLFRPRTNRSAYYTEDDFVVPDDEPHHDVSDEEDDWIEDKTVSLATQAAFSVPNDEAYNATSHENDKPGIELESILGGIPDGNAFLAQPIKLLDDLVDHELLRVSDIQSASAIGLDLLQNERQSVENGTGLQSRLLADPRLLGFSSSDDVDHTLASLYSRLATGWLGSLPRNTATRTRLQKEKTVRQVAGTLYLASHTIGGDKSITGEAQDQAETQSSQAQDLLSSQSSAASAESPMHAKLRDPVAKLRHYTSFTDTPTTLSKPVSKILQHWQTGTNPTEYDYITVTTAVDEAIDDEAGSTDIEKKKRRRTEERRRKRDETMARKRAKLELTSQTSQPLSSARISQKTPASSTERRPRTPQAQSQQDRTAGRGPQAPSSSQPTVPASQALPGRFGDRLAFRGKRRAGF